MGDFEGPWSGRRPPPPQRRRFVLAAQRGVRLGVVVWLSLMTLTGVAFLVLARLFPGRLEGLPRGEALQDFALMALVSSGLLAVSRIDLGRGLRHAGLWLLIVALLFAGYAFKDDLALLAVRARLALLPEVPARAAPDVVALAKSDDGGFYVEGRADGAPVRFLIDTGSSEIVLSPDDARRVGVDLSTLRFTRPGATANGVAWTAPYMLDRLQIGPIRLKDVPVVVNRAPMPASLLGWPFLRRLKSFTVAGDQLRLRAAP